MEVKCRFCGKILEEKEVEDMYCHCCGALTYEGMCNRIAKKLIEMGYNTNKVGVIAGLSDLINDYKKIKGDEQDEEI